MIGGRHTIVVVLTCAVAMLASRSDASAETPSTAWLDAAREGDTATLRKLAGKRPARLVDTADASGYTALILASYHGRVATVAWLLANRASTCSTDTRGFTALMGAVFRGHEAIVKQLGSRRCGADFVTPTGQTPLMLASLFGRTAIVQLLLAAGADPTRKDSSGSDARSLAETQGNEPLVAILAKAIASRNGR